MSYLEDDKDRLELTPLEQAQQQLIQKLEQELSKTKVLYEDMENALEQFTMMRLVTIYIAIIASIILIFTIWF